MRVLVTGCTGYVGQQIAIRLAGAGHQVIGSSRRPASLAGVDILTGDHLDEGFVEASVGSCDAVIHFAARTRGRDPALFRRDNEELTRLWCRTASRLGRRFVYISSDQAVYRTGPYGRSKNACEEIVARESDNYASVRLSAVLGRYAPSMASTFSMIIQRLHKSTFIVVPGNCAFPIAPVWIGDIEDVLLRLLALERLPNEVFELCGPVITLGSLLDLFEARLGVRRLRLGVPIVPLQAMARTLKPFRVFARLPLDALLDLGSEVRVSPRKLAASFGFSPTDMSHAVVRIEDFPDSA